MPREIQESNRAYVVRRAATFAITGSFANCHAIEVSLRSEGILDAHELLGPQEQRRELSAICAHQQKRLRSEATEIEKHC